MSFETRLSPIILSNVPLRCRTYVRSVSRISLTTFDLTRSFSPTELSFGLFWCCFNRMKDAGNQPI